MLQLAKSRPTVTGEVVERDALPSLMPAWEALCGNSVEDNVYYSPRYAQALLNNIRCGVEPRFALVWSEADLIGFLPFTTPKLGIPIAGTGARAWQTDYTFICCPLLDRDRAADAADVLVDILASAHPGEWVIPRVYTQGRSCRAMIDALQAGDRPWQFSNKFLRATLKAGESFDVVTKSHVSSKRRRELARNRRRIEELGAVQHETHRGGAGLKNAIAAFLQIEAGGWKGQRGTALVCDPATKAFALDAFTDSKAPSICRADLLTLAGKPIAAGITVFAGRTGFAVKCAYDETYRTCSAGLLLELEIMRSFLAESWADRLDAGTEGEHVIEELWPGRLEVADLLFSCAPRYPHWRLSAFQRADQAKQTAKQAAKSLLRRFTED
jgi:hypothetical protein